jgi:DMSO/TMAO reductase YedYZ molybdopterin-dependent catalytic subunit
MRRNVILTGAIIGLAVTLPLVALMYLGEHLTNVLPMPAFDLLQSVTRIQALGGVVTKFIELMVSIFSGLPGVATDVASKSFEQLSAVLLFLVLGAIAGALFAARRPANRSARSSVSTLAMIGWVLTFGFEILTRPAAPEQVIMLAIWLGVLYVGWAYAIAWALDHIYAGPAPEMPAGSVPNASRRQFLFQFGGGVLAVTLGAWGIGALLGRRTASSAAGKPLEAAATVEPTAVANNTAPNTSFVAAPGTRPEVTANADFYRVDVNFTPPSIDEKTWTLAVNGLVNTPLSLSYDDIRKMPATEQDATLECISNEVGGDLISSTHWTGVKLADVFKKAGLKDGVVEVRFTCADGYTESLPLESAMDERTLLVYATNGEALADIHGFPLRLYTPNRYGMKNPKWITQVEAIGTPFDGYWEERGWDKDAFVKSTAVIDNIATDKVENGAVPVGGIAFAGARGISKVEVAVDDGPWQEALLKDPISQLTWRLWRFDWTAAKGNHLLKVRTTDGQGQPQIETPAPLHPDGASGYHSKSADIA